MERQQHQKSHQPGDGPDCDGSGSVDVQRLEWWAWAPLVALILVAGVFPKIVLGVTDDAVQNVLRAFGGS